MSKNLYIELKKRISEGICGHRIKNVIFCNSGRDLSSSGGDYVKNHIDFADDLDIVVNHENRNSALEKHFGDLIGAGIPLFGLAGGLLRNILFEILTRFHVKNGYRVVETPLIASTELFKVSGHLDFFREHMYIFQIEDKEFAIKPMNCPFHMLILTNLLQKYRNKLKFPFRIFELGRVHRYEPSGSLFGLLRVRAFTQDDAHIFAEPEDVESEFIKVFREMKEIYEKLFQIPITRENIKLRLSFSDPEKIGKYYAGSPEDWKEAQKFLENIAKRIKEESGIEYYIEEGEAAFYGPKLDVIAKIGDSEWQIGTIQFDFNLPERFGINKLLKKIFGGDKKVYMVHRALLGSIERFLGVYLEYKKGRLPFVLAPIQVLLLGILTGKEDVDEKIKKKIDEIYENLKKDEIRVARLFSSKTELNSDIRRIETTIKPPVLVFIGEKEINEDKITIKYYNLRENKYEFGNNLQEVIKKLEEPVKELIGYSPRIFEDFEFMV